MNLNKRPTFFEYIGNTKRRVSVKGKECITPFNANELAVFKKEFLNTGSAIRAPSTTVYSNGDVYKGEVDKLGLRHGLGFMYYKNGELYIGKWKNDLANGCAVYTTARGDKYIGMWKNNMFTWNKNMIIFANGDRYEGETQNGFLCGHGKMTYENGDVYVGEWFNNNHHGNGRLQYVYDDVYAGQFINGEKNGHGYYHWQNGNMYKGYWLNDNFHGDGVLDATNSLGNIYYGPWDQNVQTEMGRIVKPNGSYTMLL